MIAIKYYLILHLINQDHWHKQNCELRAMKCELWSSDSGIPGHMFLWMMTQACKSEAKFSELQP